MAISIKVPNDIETAANVIGNNFNSSNIPLGNTSPNNGDVLTWNGTEYDPAPSSGGGGSFFTATIGSGGDYATIRAALAALVTTTSSQNIKLVLLNNVTESASFTWPSGSAYSINLYILVPDSVIWSTGNYNLFNINSDLSFKLVIDMQGGVLNYQFSSNNTWFNSASGVAGEILTFRGNGLINNLTSSSFESYLYKAAGASGGTINFLGLYRWIVPNNITAGIFNSSASVNVVGKLDIAGSGSSCGWAMIVNKIVASEINFSGTFAFSTDITIAANYMQIGAVNGKSYISVTTRGILSAGADTTTSVTFEVATNGQLILNDFPEVVVALLGSNSIGTFTNCNFTTYGVTLEGTYRFNNCIFDTINISVNANNNVMLGCTMFDGTITLESGVENNQIGFFHATNGVLDITDNSGNLSNIYNVAISST